MSEHSDIMDFPATSVENHLFRATWSVTWAQGATLPKDNPASVGGPFPAPQSPLNISVIQLFRMLF